MNGISYVKSYEARKISNNGLEIVPVGKNDSYIVRDSYSNFTIDGVIPTTLNKALLLLNAIVFKKDGGNCDSDFNFEELTNIQAKQIANAIANITGGFIRIYGYNNGNGVVPNVPLLVNGAETIILKNTKIILKISYYF